MANKFCWNHPNMTTLHSAAQRLHAEKLGSADGLRASLGALQSRGHPWLALPAWLQQEVSSTSYSQMEHNHSKAAVLMSTLSCYPSSLFFHTKGQKVVSGSLCPPNVQSFRWQSYADHKSYLDAEPWMMQLSQQGFAM